MNKQSEKINKGDLYHLSISNTLYYLHIYYAYGLFSFPLLYLNLYEGRNSCFLVIST